MAQYDVYRNPSSNSGKTFPYLLDVQASLLEDLDTRLIVPLAAEQHFSALPLQRLTPSFELNGQRLIMAVPELASMSKRQLGERVVNLEAMRNEIIQALDLALTGI